MFDDLRSLSNGPQVASCSVSDGLHQWSKLQATNSAHSLNKDMGVWLFTRGIVVTFNKIQNRMAINLIIFFLVFKNFYTEFAEFDYKNRNYQFATCNLQSCQFHTNSI